MTAVVATCAALVFWWQRQGRVRRLERYLEKAKQEHDGGADDGPARRVSRLMVECFMTESQVFEAALKSTKSLFDS